jgi:glutamate/aspartate transport system permease protein
MLSVLQSFDIDVLTQNSSLLLQGMWVTLQLTFAAVIGGLLIGSVLAVARLSSIRLIAIAATLYVNLVRSVPLILVIFWIYIVVPAILKQPIDAFKSVLIAFVLFEAAYYCEIIRGGISGIRRGQIDAGLALGLSSYQTMRYVILPQAFRNMMPALLTQSIIMFQDTSLAYVVGLRDFLTSGEIIANNTNRPTEIFLTIGFVYLAICFTASRLVAMFTKAVRT